MSQENKPDNVSSELTIESDESDELNDWKKIAICPTSGEYESGWYTFDGTKRDYDRYIWITAQPDGVKYKYPIFPFCRLL